MMGPISGEMSMAPMITAVELVFRPSEAMKMARIRISMLVPLKETPSRIALSALFLRQQIVGEREVVDRIFLE